MDANAQSRRNYTTKKHKTWDGDGTISVSGGYATMRDLSGKEMGRSTCNGPLLPGSTLSIGGKEVEVDSMMSKEEYFSRRPTSTSSTSSVPKPVPVKQEKLLPNPKQNLHTRPLTKPAIAHQKEETKKTLNVAAPKSAASQQHFKNPILSSTVMPKTEGRKITPRHDPDEPGAIVMKRPKSVPKGKEIVDVVVDPFLTKHLREHQREGVKFLYECVMGMRDFDGQGAILADEMGLGKTLQTITLIWTLLKQNPIYEDAPVIKKALIVCPVTLINNWRKEFRKWLGNERLGVYVADNTKTRITDFTMGKSYSVMIIGYEKLRTVQAELQKGSGIDIIIADEGHRLKTEKNKSAQAMKSLNTPRRIILSGTPIQNELSEFFMMVDFVNPGLLGTLKAFTKSFEAPIIKSRQPEATKKDIEKGAAKNEELSELTKVFILRRTADILSKYLPPKTEYVLLCRPTTTQASVYQHVLASPMFQSALGNAESSLQLITILKKVCNSPKLLNSTNNSDASKPISPLTAALISSIPPHLIRNESSTKMHMLDELLHTIQTTTTEKVVLVSNFTSTLDLLSQLLTSLGMPHQRLDGTTPSSKRQELVDTFNNSPASSCFAFLLSAKAGGMGLNLIGASRLVLFDVDWNPSVDLQAMARIHRDGQKRPCVIYRFLMAGGLDEKIWQRQVTKLGLASSVMGDQKGGGTSSFTREELRDLFRLDQGESCQTHDLIECNCGGRGMSEDIPGEFINIDSYETLPDDPTSESLLAPSKDDEDSDSDDDRPLVPHLVPANQIDVLEQERRIKAKQEARVARNKKKSGAGIQSLMAYSHINTSRFKKEEDPDMEALIRDEILLKVLKDEGSKVDFVFAKTSG